MTTEPSTADLIASALATPDEDARRPAVRALQDRPTRETFEAAMRLLSSEAAAEREIGIEILAQFGINERERPFYEETVARLLDLLGREQEPRVLEALGTAFGHLREPRGIDPLCALADHPEARVRFGVVQGLLTQQDERAVRALIRLSADGEDRVRDWATFGLGTLIPLDTPTIRDALAARLDDHHEETREEAMYGLAMRLDPRAIPVLLELLEDYEGPMLDSALLVLADHLDDPRLPAAIADHWPDGVPADARERADDDYWHATYDPAATA